MKPRAAGVLAAVLLVAVAAALTLWPAAPTPRPGSVEVVFAQEMLWHHAQATEMAARIRPRTGNVTVRSMAADIGVSQGAQMEQLRGWLRRWHQSPFQAPSPAHARAMGMATRAEVEALSTLPLPEAERRFAALMLRHHQGALLMALPLDRPGVRPEVRRFAHLVTVTQGAEINTLRQLVTRLGGRPLPFPAPGSGEGHGHMPGMP